jgi:branched-chain amino acid transport system permease protein
MRRLAAASLCQERAVTLFFQQMASGISIGAIYALLAVGYALVYSVYSFTNWAFDALMVAGAFAAFYGVSLFVLPFWTAVVFALVATVVLSITVERLGYRPLRTRNAPRLFMMISAMGVNIALVNTMNMTFGGAIRKFPTVTTGALQIGGVAIGRMDVIAAVLSFAALGALWAFLHFTKAGLGIRASAIDTTTAGLMGINNNTVALLIFGITGLLSASSGVFYGIKYAVSPAMGTVTIKAMIASIIGGLGSLPGAVVGSLLLGVVETLVAGYISSIYRDLFSFTILIIILLFFPNGLMGRRSADKL